VTTWEEFLPTRRAKDGVFFDLRDVMDWYYPEGWTYRTAAHAGSDIGAPVNAIASLARAYYSSLVFILTPGYWRQTVPFSSEAIEGNHLEGVGGKTAVNIFYDNATQPYLLYTGGPSGDPREGGSKATDIVVILEEGLGPCSDFLVLAVPADGRAPSAFKFDGIFATSSAGSSWRRGIYADGRPAITPYGIRVGDFRNCTFFARIPSEVYGAVKWTFYPNIGLYPMEAEDTGHKLRLESCYNVQYDRSIEIIDGGYNDACGPI